MLKILLVDDDPQMQKYCQTALKDFHFDFAESVESARTLILEHNEEMIFYYDLIIIEVQLQDKNDLKLSKWIRSLSGGGYPFILMVTSQTDMQSIKELLENDCDDYIAKPLEDKIFRERIEVAVKRVESRRKYRKIKTDYEELLSHMATVLDSLCIGVIFLNKKLKTIYHNTPAEHITQNTIKLKKKLSEILPLTEESRKHLLEWEDTPEPEGRLRLQMQNDYWVELEIFIHTRYLDHIIYIRDITELTRFKNSTDTGFYGVSGQSRAAQNIQRQIKTLAVGEWNILIEGETGTGKEIVARQLHKLSPRAENIFLSVNCAGLTETLAASVLFGHKKGSFTGAYADHKGYFEAAEGGTLFLDEIGDIPPAIQVMLLRAIELKEITRVGETQPRSANVRIITATNKSLSKEIGKGTFRADLFYRLNSAYIKLPPLRERKEDIPLFITYFLNEYRIQYGAVFCKVSHDALKVLMNYSWPGNIRELKSVIQFAAVQATGSWIAQNNLPDDILYPADETKRTLAHGDDEKTRIADAIKMANGNIAQAARLLGISRATLYRKVTKYGLVLRTATSVAAVVKQGS